MIGSRLPDEIHSMMQNLSSWNASVSDAAADTQTCFLPNMRLGPFDLSALQLPGNLSIPGARIQGDGLLAIDTGIPRRHDILTSKMMMIPINFKSCPRSGARNSYAGSHRNRPGVQVDRCENARPEPPEPAARMRI
jgi:hypothetical protein